MSEPSTPPRRAGSGSGSGAGKESGNGSGNGSGSGGRRTSAETARLRRRAAWGALAVVVVVALVVGARTPAAQTPAQKAASIAGEVRCPTCEGQSAEVSDAPAAQAVRTFILAEVEAGQSRGRIEQELEDRYGSDILLRPPASGVAGLVWVLPIVALVLAVAGLAVAFRRWRTVGEAPVTDADRRRVAEALIEDTGGEGP